MREIPDELVRARERAQDSATEPLDLDTAVGLRRALGEVFEDHQPMFSKILADGTVSRDETRLLGEAMARVARYYEVAHAFEPEPALLAGHAALLAALEAQARAVAAALDGARSEALDHADEALRHLARGPQAGADAESQPVTPREKIYDRETGRSKYDSREEPYLSYRLRCPKESCAHPDEYRLPPRTATQRLECNACGTPFSVYAASVSSATAEAGLGVVRHRVITRDHDGTRRELRFDEATDPPGLEIKERDLLIVIYDEDNRLCIVRNYTRGGDVWVAPRSRCFVATAALGPHAPEVVRLRVFRDEVLAASSAGRRLIGLYERVGPRAADWVSRSRHRRRLARALIRALAALATGGASR